MATMLECVKYEQEWVHIDDVMEDAVSQCIGALYHATTHGSTPEVRSHANKLRNRLSEIRNEALYQRHVNGKPVPLTPAKYAKLYETLAGVYRDVKILKPFLPAGSIELLVYDNTLHVVGSAWSAAGKLAGALKPEITIDF